MKDHENISKNPSPAKRNASLELEIERKQGVGEGNCDSSNADISLRKLSASNSSKPNFTTYEKQKCVPSHKKSKW